MASLFVIQGRDQGKRFELDEAVLASAAIRAIRSNCTTPKSPGATPRSSRRTAGLTLVDLSSSNGTFVNSQRVEQQELHSGDRVLIGRTLMIFTGNEDKSSVDLAEEVAIVQPPPPGRRLADRHRRSARKKGSRIFAGEESPTSPWLARARSNLQVMYHTALAVSHTLDIDQLLQRIMELIFEWVEADRGCIMLADRETERADAQGLTATAESAPGEPAEKLQISQTILDYVMRTGRRADQQRPRGRTLGRRGEHPEDGRAGGDLRPHARPLRSGRRDLHRHLHAARARSCRTGT